MNTINIEMIPPYKIAFMRKIGPYGPENQFLMEQFKEWIKSKELLNSNTIILGIAQDNPASTLPDRCRYDTCLVISDITEIKDTYNNYPVNTTYIRGGRYAVFKIQHTAEAVQKTWNEMFIDLSRENLTFDDERLILERYKAELVENHYCEICVPIH